MRRTSITKDQAYDILTSASVLVFDSLGAAEDLSRPYLHDDGDGETIWIRDEPDIEPEDFAEITSWYLEQGSTKVSNLFLTAWINNTCIWRCPVVLANISAEQVLANL